MRAIVQRVRSAAVQVEDERIAEIGRGVVVLLGVGSSDRPEDGERLAAKVAGLRIFEEEGKMQRALSDVRGSVVVVPQFTLYGDARHGRRPEFTAAAAPDVGHRLFDAFCGVLRGKGLDVRQGRFGAAMRVTVEADGPVTIALSTDGWPESDIGR
ncbi:MAG: D-tyrosyl-tRNA(Tyr) deacylase [Chloroflexi bacterium 13_1_40CM_68_21]|nr:MAG: D-tyrosyl-tRNA(Tyr) deacylase [Chloroflexi bacterium 13_1_40CM_68_21]